MQYRAIQHQSSGKHTSSHIYVMFPLAPILIPTQPDPSPVRKPLLQQQEGEEGLCEIFNQPWLCKLLRWLRYSWKLLTAFLSCSLSDSAPSVSLLCLQIGESKRSRTHLNSQCTPWSAKAAWGPSFLTHNDLSI